MLLDNKLTRNILFSVGFLFIFYSSSGQDKIIKIDNSVIEGVILKVDANSIEVDPVGTKPFLIVPRKDVKLIIYSDNTVVDFGSQINVDQAKTDINQNEKSAINAQITRSAFIDIYAPRSPYKQDNYVVDELLEYNDTLNNEKFNIRITGSFSVSGDSDTGIQIRKLNLNIEVIRGGARFSEDLLFKPSYKIGPDTYGFQELDKVKGINIKNNFLELELSGLYNLEGKSYSTGNNLFGTIGFIVVWSNF